MKHFLHHLFFPRESNNHRSKLLHHDSLLLVIALLFFSTSFGAVVHKTHPEVLGISSNIAVQDLLALTNQKRQENGLAPLQLDTELSHAAEQKAQNMFTNNYWAHISPDGTTPWYFIKHAGYEYLYAGENLARGFTTAPAVVDAWMASPSHRENMLSKNYNDIGFAVSSGTLTGSETILVVEEFGSRYLAEGQPKQVEVAVALPTPTIVPPQTISQVPVSPTPTGKPKQPASIAVAAIQNQPLIDSKSMTRTISFALLGLFIAVLIIDAVIVERKKIARVVAHNLDHILFFVILVLVALIIGRGGIL